MSIEYKHIQMSSDNTCIRIKNNFIRTKDYIKSYVKTIKMKGFLDDRKELWCVVKGYSERIYINVDSKHDEIQKEIELAVSRFYGFKEQEQ